MESELEDLRCRATAAETLRARLQRLEEQTSEVQAACVARDAKIAQLEDLLRGAVDQQLQTVSRPGGGDSTADKIAAGCWGPRDGGWRWCDGATPQRSRH